MKGKQKFSNNKLIFIICVVVLSLVALAGLTTAFLLSYNGSSPKAPLILEDGENIYISTEANDGYEGYRFKFSSTEEEIIIDCDTNIISSTFAIEKGVQLGKTYNISTCYLSEKEGNNSEYSKEIPWICSVYLTQVNIRFNEEKCQLEWDAVENADSYRVFYNGQDNYVEIDETFYSLKDVKGGEKVFSVLPISNNIGYKTNNSVKYFKLSHTHYLEGFLTISFDRETCQMTATSNEEYSSIIVYLDETTFVINMFSIVEESGIYSYTIDISSIYEGQLSLGLLPANQDEYNLNNGQPKVMLLPSQEAE